MAKSQPVQNSQNLNGGSINATQKPSAPKERKEKKNLSKPIAASPKREAVVSGSKKSAASKIEDERAVDQELLYQLAESLGSLAPSTKESRPSHFKVDLPSSLQIQEEAGTLSNCPRYGETVSAILQNSLDLPEFGRVVARIQIDANGNVAQCDILETRSRKNSEFLKKRLQELTFPCFNEFGLLDAQLNFTITFHNAENR